jgi:hypothetical protein
MNAVKLLADTVDNLWIATYSIIAGWGITLTLIIVALVLLLVRTINLQRRIDQLENRLIHAERDYNLSINSWKSK